MPLSRRFCSTTVCKSVLWQTTCSKDDHVGAARALPDCSLTLMSHPFALLDEVRLSSEGHEVALHNEPCMLLAEEEGHAVHVLIVVACLVVRRHACCE